MWRQGVDVAGLLATVLILFTPHAVCWLHTALGPRMAQAQQEAHCRVSWFLHTAPGWSQAGDERRCGELEEMQAPWRCLRPRRAVLAVLTVFLMCGEVGGWLDEWDRCKKVDG